MFMCVFFLKKRVFYAYRWKFAKSGGGCPSLAPQKQTWDNDSGQAITWEFQGMIVGGGQWGRKGCVLRHLSYGRVELKSMGKYWGAENTYLGMSPSDGWGWGSLCICPFTQLLVEPCSQALLISWHFRLAPQASGDSSSLLWFWGTMCRDQLMAGADWTVWGMRPQPWEPFPWQVHKVNSFTLSS